MQAWIRACAVRGVCGSVPSAPFNEIGPGLWLRLLGNARRIRREEAVMRALRVYADTSVFGGVFDTEFALSIHAPQEVVVYEEEGL